MYRGHQTTTPSGAQKDFIAGDHGKEREELPPMEYGLQRDPPPPRDRPDVDGDSWREAVQLGHLTGEDRDEILDMLEKHRSMWSG
jgi:hypothetical protein